MKIESPVLGTIEVSEEKIIEFRNGLPGFENCRRFALLHEEGAEPTLFLLQSVDDPEVMFSITGPETLGVTYEFSISDEEADQLALTDPKDAVIAIIVRKDEESDSPSTAGMRANFMAPLVINVPAQRGMQKVFPRLGAHITLRAEA
jgi:flagellar assembly factor FliW